VAVAAAPPEVLPARQVVRAGEDAGHPVVLLHGFTGSSAAWGDALLRGLSEKRQVIAVDLPGHGASRRGEGAVMDVAFSAASSLGGKVVLPLTPGRTFTDVVDLLVAHLGTRDIVRADWIGYSMGGRLALAVAVRHPERVRRLVLESASPGLETEAERTLRAAEDEELACQIEERGLEWFVTHWERLPLFKSQSSLPIEVQEGMRAVRLACDPNGLAGALRVLGVGAQPSYWGDLKKVGTPTLLVTGTLDAKFVDIALKMRRLMPNAEHLPIPGAGHTVHLESPSAWTGAVTRFLDRE
jgi:2-succinyl-6-hydroxy-2,4-cyclohexadiene-1-carboxylate synthase